jgi:hypothetical protein
MKIRPASAARSRLEQKEMEITELKSRLAALQKLITHLGYGFR